MGFLGIDLGTGGVRCLLVEDDGTIRSESSQELGNRNLAREAGRSEQNPREWVLALEGAMDHLFSDPANRDLHAIAVDSTSGTVLPVCPEGNPLGMALLYDDMRATEEAAGCGEVFGGMCSPTFSLPKIRWMHNNLDLPEDVLFLHAADFVNSWLADTPGIPTDFTNAMKTGFDPALGKWPGSLEDLNLPEVVAPGERFGFLSEKHRRRWRLPREVALVSGATDSNAAFYASGAASPGDWSTTVGTTMAFKGLSAKKIEDPHGRIYCHRHPDGSWLPGGASNAGGEIVRRRFGNRIEEIEMRALEQEETSHLIYPSVRQGERLPFASSSFKPFSCGEEDDEVGFFLGCLEGMACLEAMVFELIESLGGIVGGSVYATGGGARSRQSLQVRADLLSKSIKIPAHPHSAMGAAILAAAGFHHDPVGNWSRKMVKMAWVVEPRGGRENYYRDRFLEFKERCHQSLT
ncbi:MAG: FGGY-family carbohydrate kinase [Roseibacillus sp.]|nr:FGGY-family carbohydrate kinase [Roseibacillus sp.]